MAALGERQDWEDLRVYGALLGVGTNLFSHKNVHYLSGFYGPFERALRDQGANVSFAPADFRRFAPLLEEQAPRVMATAAAPPDADGWCSLSLHAGGTSVELVRAAEDPDRLLVVEVSEKFPRTFGVEPEHRHALHVDAIDVLVESDGAPLPLPDAEPGEADREIARHAAAFVPDGATLQTGIGTIPSAIAAELADSGGGDYGVHSEMFTNGLMALHEAGKVSNAHKGCYEGVSVATFAAGSEELYGWLHENRDVAFLPVDLVNSAEAIARNEKMITINGALAIDIHGQVVADTIGGAQFSGIGGHEDFIAGPALDLDDRALLCFPSTYEHGRRAALADRALVRGGRGDHHAAPPGRRGRDRARRRRAPGQDRPPARRGAGRDRPSRLPRRAARRRRARLGRAGADRAVGTGVETAWSDSYGSG